MNNLINTEKNTRNINIVNGNFYKHGSNGKILGVWKCHEGWDTGRNVPHVSNDGGRNRPKNVLKRYPFHAHTSALRVTRSLVKENKRLASGRRE